MKKAPLLTISKKLRRWWWSVQQNEHRKEEESIDVFALCRSGVNVTAGSNVQVWTMHTCLSLPSHWLRPCDYDAIPLSSESLLVCSTHQQQRCWSREMITWGVAGWSDLTQSGRINLYPTSTLQAEVSLQWNGTHDIWQLLSGMSDHN